MGLKHTEETTPAKKVSYLTNQATDVRDRA